MDKDTRISQLEDEVCKLRAELEKAQGSVKIEQWGRAFDTLPDGAVFHSMRDMQTGELVFKHVSSAWQGIMGVSAEDTLANSENIMSRVHPDDLPVLYQEMNKAANDATKLEVEFRYLHPEKDGEEYWLELTSYPVLENNRVIADGFLFDVTERKTSVKAKEYQLTKLKLVVDASSFALWEMPIVKKDDTEPVQYKKKAVMSSRFRQLLGYTDEKDFPNFIGSWSEKLHPDDKEQTITALTQHILDRSGNTPYDTEYRLLHKDGFYRYFRAYGATVRDKDGYPLRVAGAIKDITEEKLAVAEILHNKEKAEENNIRLTLLMDAAACGLWNLTIENSDTENPTYKYIWSDEMRKMLGFSSEADFPNTESAWRNKLHPDDKKRVYSEFTRYLQNKGGSAHFEIEYRIARKNGEYMHVIDVSTMMCDENGNPQNLIGAIRDVTELKLAEQKLFAEKIRLEKMSNNIPDSVLYRIVSETDTGKTYLEYAGSNWENVVGAPASVFQKNLDLFHEMVHPDDKEYVREANAHSLKTLKDFKVEFKFPVNGKNRWLHLSSKLYRKGNLVFADGICMNITARKEAELKLEIEKERLQNLGDNIPYGTVYRYVYDTVKRKHSFEYVSAGWEKVMGYSGELALNNLEKAFKYVHPEDLPRLHQSVEQSLKTMTTFDIEYRLIVDGVTRWVRKSAHPRKEGKFIIWDGLGIDITERKEAQAKLKFEKERLQMMGDNIPNGALFQFTLDAKTGRYSFEYVSARWEEVMGFSAESALNDKVNSFAYIHPDDLPIVKNALEKSVKTLQPFNTEHRNVVDGRVYWVHMASYARRENGLIIWDGIAINTTSRKEAELKLEQEKERLETLGNNIPNGALYQFILDKKTGKFSYLYVSSKWEKVVGCSSNDFLCYLENDIERNHPILEAITVSAENLSVFDFELYFEYRENAPRCLHFSSQPQLSGDIVVWDGIAIDVSARKEADLELEKERTRLKALGSNLPDVALYQFIKNTVTGKMHYSYVSGTWETITGVPAHVAMNDAQAVIDTIHPDDRELWKEKLEHAIETLTDFYLEVRTIIDGRVRWRQMSSRLHREGDLVIADGTMLDITLRKEAEINLELENERLQTLGDNIPNGALYRCVLDIKTNKICIVYVSAQWEDVMGYSAELTLRHTEKTFEYIHPDDLPYVQKEIEYSAKNLTVFSVEYRVISGGRTRWIQVSSQPQHHDEQIIWDGIALDVTIRKEAIRKIEREHKRLEALGSNLPGVILYQFVCDKKTNKWYMPYLSQTWSNIVGISREEVMKDFSKLFTYIHPEDLPQLILKINSSVETLENFYCETRFIVQGETRWVQISSRPHTEGNMVVADGIIMDITKRKETELKLESEHKRLESIGANLPDMALYQFVRDMQTHQWHFSYVSGSWESVTGVSVEVALTDINAVFAVVHPDDLESLTQAIKDTGMKLANFIKEIRLIVNGKTRWIQISSRHRRDGILVIADGIIMDITNRKVAEHELEYERNRLKILGDNIPGGCLFQFVRDTCTNQMRFSYLSASWDAVTGIPAEQAMSNVAQLFSVMRTDELPKFLRAIDDSARTMTDFNVVFRTKERWLQVVSRPRAEEKMIVWDGIVIDITVRKNAEIALEESESTHRFIFDNTKEMFWVADAKTFDLTFIGGAAYEMYGMTNDEIIGKNLYDFFETQSSNNCATLINHAIELYNAEGIFQNIQFVEQQIRKDGSSIWIETSAQLVADEDGNITQLVGIDRNIDERVKNETELAQYREHLELKVQERTEELQKAVNELAAISEELFAANEELSASNEELNAMNEQLQLKNDQLDVITAEHEKILKELENFKKS